MPLLSDLKLEDCEKCMTKKKLAIVTLYGDNNFGNKLQNYAVQCYFEAYGMEVKTLTYWERNHIVYDLHSLLYCIKENLLHRDPLLKKRIAMIKSFSDDYIKLGEEVRYRKIDKNLADRYDYFVSGSDQVWHCWSGEKKELEYFLLSFARSEQRLTMAPSFGFKEFDSKFQDVYKSGLEGFRLINCREQEAADLIHSLTGKTAEVVLDPTMLIDTGIWEKIRRRPDNFCEDRYILTYTLGEMPAELRSAVEKYCIDNKLTLINLMDKNDKYYISTRPDEFLYWIDNAELVFTDSFHATVFSILFNTGFITFSRHKEGGMENRIDTLLKTFSLIDRKYKSDDERFLKDGLLVREEIDKISFSSVYEVLARERKKAELFYSKCMDM